MSRARDLADLGTSFSGTENNVSLGENALDSVTTGTNNVALGEDALGSNTTASNNTAVGYQALVDNTTGASLVAVGEGALANNTTASDNTAVGKSALNGITTGTSNTAVGKDALGTNQTSNSNTAIGKGAGSSTTVAAGTYVGSLAGENTNSVSNTFVGANAGQIITSGEKNTILGRYNGNENGVDIRTSSNQIILSDGDGNARARCNSGDWIIRPSASSTSSQLSSEAFGVDALGVVRNGFAARVDSTAYYTFMGQNPSNVNTFRVYGSGDVQNTNNSYGSISDQKVKENISDAGSQWDDIKAIRVRKYSLIMDELDTANQIGVIAQELEASGMGGLVQTDTDRDEDMNDLGTVTKSVKYSVLYMKAVKALQEAMDRIETLETENTAIKARLDALEAE